MLSSRGGLGEICHDGILLAADERDLAIVVASANTRELLGIEPNQLLAAGLSSVVASPTEKQLRESLALGATALELVTTSGARFDTIVHRDNGLVVLELEPSGTKLGLSSLQRAISRLESAHRVNDIVRTTAEEIRALVGFDRVALYRNRGGAIELAFAFPDDGMAPAPVALEPGEQMRSIPDRLAPAVPLIGARAVDLRLCELRASPCERKPGAELAIRLGEWGVVVCEHPSAKRVPYSGRAAVRALASIVAWHLDTREKLVDELRASNMAKDEFLATVSHELRTPLNAMLGWLRLIQADQVAADRKAEALATVARNAHALAQLVEELLDASRVITGKMRLELQPITPVSVVEAALAIAEPAAEAKNLAIRTQLDPGAGPVLADASRLQQVIWNLLTNAVKFTPEGGTVDVRLQRAGSWVQIEIADNGIGIATETLPHVFERFRQGEDATTRAHGLGLGLSIVRHLVELHGGDVTAASAGQGHGATFTVRLPIATGRSASAQMVAVVPPAFEPAPQLRGVRVLTVDDEHDASDLIRAVLQTSGVDVITASSAAEALALLPSVKPHVLISDIGMPDIDGYALIQEVRKLHDEVSRIPAIAVTAFARSHDRSRAFLAGFDIYLAKPVDPAELVAVLCNLTDRRTTNTTPWSRARLDAITSGVLAGARVLVVEDDPDSAEMLAELLRAAGAEVEIAGTAAEGMERLRSFRPDVLVSDLSLPDKDGFAFIRELRATGSDEGGWIPAIAVSGHADPEHAREAILAGFQLHVAKPIDPPDLIARLARLVGRTARRT